MRPIGTRKLVWGGLFVVVAGTLAVGSALATPIPNSAVLNLRVFNDCPTSILTTTNNYPAEVTIEDETNCAAGFANLHNWRFSEDGANAAVFNNDSNFHYEADLVLSGTGECEGGLQVAPWWSQNVDGRLNVRTTDGEVACFGGRLPFFSFTATYGVVYEKGDVIHLKITYRANGLSQASPATIEYEVVEDGTAYSSGPLPFDEGNPSEPYGTWGMLDDGRVGGHIQVFIQPGTTVTARAEFTDIVFENLDPVPTKETSWGKMKSSFR